MTLCRLGQKIYEWQVHSPNEGAQREKLILGWRLMMGGGMLNLMCSKVIG